MNETQARILVLCENLERSLAFAEYISAKLDVDYNKISRYCRQMQHKGWLKMQKSGKKKLIFALSVAAIQDAKGFLENA